jgi:hypothetical protein
MVSRYIRHRIGSGSLNHPTILAIRATNACPFVRAGTSPNWVNPQHPAMTRVMKAFA